MRKALEGIRVLEMTTAVAGPVCGHILGDMGAEMIKVEEPRSRARVPGGVPPSIAGAPDRPYNRQTNYVELNRSKRSLSLNVAADEGREIYLSLAEKCDVMIENFAPRVVGNLGIDYESIKQRNPSIIYVSMPAFGKTGPYRDRGSYGPGIDAMSGISHLTGYPDREPGKPANFFCDQNAGLHAAFIIMTALRHRRRTGEGQYIEMSMLEGELQSVAPALMDVTLNGRNRVRTGNKHEWFAPHGVYKCDGEEAWIALAITSENAWNQLCKIMDRNDLKENAKFSSMEDRVNNSDELDEILSKWTADKDKHSLQKLLQSNGISAGVALRPNELFEDPQMLHRSSFAWSDHPEMGPFPHTRTAWKSTRGNTGISRHGPLFGGANDFVFRDLLGLTDDDIQSLIDAKITSYSPVTD